MLGGGSALKLGGRRRICLELRAWLGSDAPVGGKTVRARVQTVGEPAVTEERRWDAHEEGGGAAGVAPSV